MFNEINKMESDENHKKRNRRVFDSKEDKLLIHVMNTHDFQSWEKVAKFIPGRTGRQCRERWVNYLSPDLDSSPWNIIDDTKLLNSVKEYGTKWSFISKFFPGRSYSQIKNRWYSILKWKVSSKNNDQFKNCGKQSSIYNNIEITWEPPIKIEDLEFL